MRVVAALGGNALLQRGQAITAENQRENAREACTALAPVALEHELVIAHGNGPQVGLLALQTAAYPEVETYPLDILGAQTEGMIGYVIEQELGNVLPLELPFATLLTMVEVDRDDPAFPNPPSRSGPLYEPAEADRLAAERGWTFGRTATATAASSLRRSRGASSRSSHPGAAGKGRGGDLRGRRRHPDDVHGRARPAGRRLVGVEAVIDKDLAAGSSRWTADLFVIVTDVDAVYTDWGTPASGDRHTTPGELASSEFAAGSMGPKVGPRSVRRRDRRRADRIDPRDRSAVRGEAGTIVSREAPGGHHRAPGEVTQMSTETRHGHEEQAATDRLVQLSAADRRRGWGRPRGGLEPERSSSGSSTTAERAGEGAAAEHVVGRRGQLSNPMNIMLLIVAVASLGIGQIATGLVVIGLVTFNVVMGTNQELKALASVEALSELQVPHARVRRSGAVEEIESTALVPGDVMLLEAGDSFRPTVGSSCRRPSRSRRRR